jgi:hypothetical protein
MPRASPGERGEERREERRVERRQEREDRPREGEIGGLVEGGMGKEGGE